MTLLEISALYCESASLLQCRIRQLQILERNCLGPEEARRLRQRIHTLRPILRETRELAELTAHYYDGRRTAHGKIHS